MPKKPKRKAQPSDTLSPGPLAKLPDKEFIARLRKRFFVRAKGLVQDNLPYLREAHRRYSQPGRRLPVPGRPTLTEFCRQELGFTIRTMQRWLCEKPPVKRHPEKYTAIEIAHLEQVAFAAQQLADADPDNPEYEPIRKAIREKPSGLFVQNGRNHYYEGNKADGKHYWLTPKKMWEDLQKRFPGIWDSCPYPRKPGYDALKVPWHKTTYCNCPFLTIVNDDGEKIGFTAWCRKAISEQNKGKTIVMVFPMDYGWHLLLNAGAEFRSIGDVKWQATEDNSTQSSGRKIVEIVLRPKKAAKAA